MSCPHPHKIMVARVAFVALLAAATLSGCSEARRALGYDKAPPDEFAVLSRAPLSQPPDYTLRPPTPNAPRPQEGTTRDQAKAVLLGSRGTAEADTNGLSQGEKFLLTKAGADKAEADIRRHVDEETTSLIQADKSVTDKILFWQDKPAPGEALDVAAEAKRLKDNAAQGKPAADGDTPQIVRRKKGLLDDIF